MARCACGHEHGVVDGECNDCRVRREYAALDDGMETAPEGGLPWPSQATRIEILNALIVVLLVLLALR